MKISLSVLISRNLPTEAALLAGLEVARIHAIGQDDQGADRGQEAKS